MSKEVLPSEAEINLYDDRKLLARVLWQLDGTLSSTQRIPPARVTRWTVRNWLSYLQYVAEATERMYEEHERLACEELNLRGRTDRVARAQRAEIRKERADLAKYSMVDEEEESCSLSFDDSSEPHDEEAWKAGRTYDPQFETPLKERK